MRHTKDMETKTGGCHCKSVRYEAKADLSKEVIECNCSHCQIKGLLLSFIPSGDFRITEGEGNLTEYRFNTNKITHLFCRTCGVEAFAYGQDNSGNKTTALNVRSLDGIDLSAIKRMPFDGRNM
jgi:hypothetical protein